MHLPAPRERLDQAPFRTREILEAVGEHRRPVPGSEIRREPVDGAAADHAAVVDSQPLQLGRIRPGERRKVATEILGIEKVGLDLGQRTAERIGEPGEP